MKKRIRLIAFDLDQTLLRRDKTLSPATAAALSEAARRGIILAAASGRSYASLPEVILTFPGIPYAITGNGAAVCRLGSGEIIRRCRLERESVRKILELTPEEFALEGFIDGRAYAAADYVQDPPAFGTPAAAISYIQSTRQPVEDIRAFLKAHGEELDSIDIVTRDAICGAPEVRAAIEREVSGIYVTSSVPQMVEISHADAGKAKALCWLAKRLGISAEETAAFGDAENDREMIRWAGLGVAMGNADPMTKEAADLVAATNQEDGVARVLEAIFEEL